MGKYDKDRLDRAVRIRVFGGIENSKPHWATDDLWVEADGIENRDAYERIETDFVQIALDMLMIYVDDRAWVVTLKEIIAETPAPAPPAIAGQISVEDLLDHPETEGTAAQAGTQPA